MTYTEWRDELKSNLLCVSESERRRVLEYYAEAYADRREAGYSEREIVAEFGAPYDAAKRILSEDDRDLCEAPKRPLPAREAYFETTPVRSTPYKEEKREKTVKVKKKNKTSWVFIVLCVVFAVPILAIILTLSGITFAAFVAPFAVLLAGVGETGLGVGMMFSNILDGLMRVGFGLILFGAGVILISVLPRIAKLFWIAFKKLGGFIKSMFVTEEA